MLPSDWNLNVPVCGAKTDPSGQAQKDVDALAETVARLSDKMDQLLVQVAVLQERVLAHEPTPASIEIKKFAMPIDFDDVMSKVADDIIKTLGVSPTLLKQEGET